MISLQARWNGLFQSVRTECGSVQADMGKGVGCEDCHYPMRPATLDDLRRAGYDEGEIDEANPDGESR